MDLSPDNYDELGLLIQSVGSFLWPVLFIVLVIVARKSINELISNFSEAILKAQTIKLSRSVSLSRDDVQTALMDREILKIGILVGASDFPDKKELNELSAQAKGMTDHVDILNNKEKNKLLYYAFELASADKVFSKGELEVILSIGQHLGLTPAKVKSDLSKYAKEFEVDVSEIQENL